MQNNYVIKYFLFLARIVCDEYFLSFHLLRNKAEKNSTFARRKLFPFKKKNLTNLIKKN